MSYVKKFILLVIIFTILTTLWSISPALAQNFVVPPEFENQQVLLHHIKCNVKNYFIYVQSGGIKLFLLLSFYAVEYKTMSYITALENIGVNIKRIRQDRGLSQSKLSYLTSIKQQNISKYEQGKQNISIKTLYRIANVLETNITTLLY